MLGWVAAAGAACAVLWGAFAGIRDYWVTSDKFKAHIKSEVAVRDWTAYNIMSVRLQYLEDKQFECESKRTANELKARSDVAICARYDARIVSTQAEANKLKETATQDSKEKVE